MNSSKERKVFILLSITSCISIENGNKYKYLEQNALELLEEIYPNSKIVFNYRIIIRYIKALIKTKQWNRIKKLYNHSIETIQLENIHVKYKFMQSVIFILKISNSLSISEQRLLKLFFKDLKIDRQKFNKFLKYQNHLVIEDKFTFKQKLPIINRNKKNSKKIQHLLLAVVLFTLILMLSFGFISSKLYLKDNLSAATNSRIEVQYSYFSKGLYSDDSLCIEPLKRYLIKPDDLLNPVAYKGIYKSKQINLQNRYIVADLEVKDRNGICKGVKEIFPEMYLLKNLNIEPITIESDHKDCRGQTLSLCQVEGNVIKLIARLVLSSGNLQKTYKNYYAPIMYIRTRHGDGRKAQNIERDTIYSQNINGISTEKLLKYNRKIPMPNFMQIYPVNGFKAETQNGIHRYPYPADRLKLGKPASQGCFRTGDLGSRFIRDWTPLGAKVFVLHPTISFSE